MDPFCAEGRSRDSTERRKLMKKEKHEKTTVTVRLTDEEDQVLSRLCTLKKMSKTGYLARLAKDQDRRAVEAFLSAVETLSKLNKDPEFYNLAVNAVRE